MFPPRAYIAHEILVAPARERPEIWRIAAGFVCIVATAFIIGNLSTSFLLLTFDRSALPVQEGTIGQTPFSLLVLLAGFIFLTLGTALAVRLFHNRSFLSVLGPRSAVARDFLRVLKALAVLGLVVAVLPPYSAGAPLTANVPPVTWLLLLPFSLIALLIQTSSEEIVFRGYLQQQLAARFSSPLVWGAVPSAVFALGHYVPAEAGGNAVFIACWAGLFGVLMADLTARAGNLGPAIAVHFANNLTAIVLVSLPDTLSGLSLYTIDLDISAEGTLMTWLPVEFAMMLLMWLTARLAIRR